MTKFQEEVVSLYNQGYAHSQICSKLNCAKSSVSSVKIRFKDILKDVTILNENTCNHNYFDIIDDEYKAYLLGFFIADGCLSSDYKRSNGRFCVSIQFGDLNIIEFFQKFIAKDSKIDISNKSTVEIKRVDQAKLRWTSKHMRDIFIDKYKITPNKTMNPNFKFPMEEIPDNLKRHFIRGFIDGDGCFEQKEGKIFTITLVSTSVDFLNQLGDEICNLSEGIEKNIKECNGKTINWFRLRFNMFRDNKPEKIFKIYNYLYKDSNIFLSRKRDKIESYLKYRGKLQDNTCNHRNA